MRKSWRQRAVEVLDALPIDKDTDPDEARNVIFRAYPFGDRHYTPYKVWNEEKQRLYYWLYPKKQKPLPKWLGGDA